MGGVSVFRPGDVSYLRIPAPDPAQSAAFYGVVFGWTFHDRSGSVGFEDATGHVIGHLMPDLPVVGEAGVVPYIYVDDIDEALAIVIDAGGHVSGEPYPEGDLWVAMSRDPAGNAIGVWQQAGVDLGRRRVDNRSSSVRAGLAAVVIEVQRGWGCVP